MKKFFYLLPAIALVFAACSDDDDNNGGLDGNKLIVKASEITNAPKDGEIDEVKLIIGDDRVISTAEWNNGFELEFPETVVSSALESLDEFFEFDDEAMESITISDKTAKLGYGWIEGYKNNTYVREFEFGASNSSQYTEARYVYSNKAVTVKGSIVYQWEEYKDTENYNLTLSQGWNRIAKITKSISDIEETTDFVSSIPSGLAWKFGYWD